MEYDINIKNAEYTQNKPKIDLSCVEEINIGNNKRFIKYIDLNTNKPVMLDISNNNKSAKEIIENLQTNSLNFNSSDAIYNTNGILGLEQKYSMKELKIIPIENIEDYKPYIPNDKLQIVQLFQKNKDNFNPKIKYINIEKGIALDSENKVITCKYNQEQNQYEVRYANLIKYNVDNKLETSNIEGSFNGIDFDAEVEKIELSNLPVEVCGYQINIEQLNKYANYPELLDRSPISSFEKVLLTKLVEAYLRRKLNQSKQNNPPKVKNLKPHVDKPNEAAFASNNLTLFVAGFTMGILFALLTYYAIKIIF